MQVVVTGLEMLILIPPMLTNMNTFLSLDIVRHLSIHGSPSSQWEMLKRALSALSTSSAQSSDGDTESKKSKPSCRSLKVNTPVVRLALSKVARGQAATLLPEICKAAVLESGSQNVSPSILMHAVNCISLLFDAQVNRFTLCVLANKAPSGQHRFPTARMRRETSKTQCPKHMTLL